MSAHPPIRITRAARRPRATAPATTLTGALAALLVAAPAAPAAAQADLPARGAALAARVAAMRDGTVRLAYPLRPGVCGMGESVRVGTTERYVGNGWIGDFGSRDTRDVEWDRHCETGPGRLVLGVEGGTVRTVRFYVGGRWRAADARTTDLGDVAADQAAGLLLRIAQGSASAPASGALRADDRAARAAIFPATLAAEVTPWPALLGIARDAAQPREARRQALHWLGIGAGEQATAGIAELSDDPDREVRLQAVVALSRRPADEGVPALIKVARTHRDPAMRRQALMWLGRSEDPRALALFEELLLARRD